MDSPYLVGHFLPSSRRNPNAPYGWSPALAALPDLKQLNKMAQSGDGAIELAAYPPMFFPKSMRGRINMRPRGHNRLADMNEMPQYLESKGQIQWVLQRTDQLRGSIQEKFLLNLFNQFRGEDLKNVTAEAVRAKLGEQESLLPMFGLLMFGYLGDLGNRVFVEMLNGGLWPEPIPRELLSVDGGVRIPKVRFANKLTQLLELTQAAASMQAVMENAQIAQATGDPSVLAPYNIRAIGLANYRARNGLSEGVYSKQEEEEREAMRQQQLEQEAMVAASQEM